MKNKTGIILILILAMIISGCSKSEQINDISKESNNPKEEIVKEQNIDVVITIHGNKFDLNQVFDKEILEKMDKSELGVLRNAIYAKHGYSFANKKYEEHFNQYSWYQPTPNNSEIKMSKIDETNIVNIITIEESIVELNTPNQKSIDLGETIVNGDITIKASQLEAEYGNFPIKLVITKDDKIIEYENSHNDGIYIEFCDLDKDDDYLDIIIIGTGTDIQCDSTIYRYNNEIFEHYSDMQHFSKRYIYDGKGNIYYWFDNADEIYSIDTYFDYREKTTGLIEDEKLKKRLAELIKEYIASR